ncbi:MAG TPA: glycosyltransferase family 2 protein [Chitinophagaceae bacterium]|nr:glycosyltransferase family 2 protein [Chitinophagaceae bacterium]
MNFAELIFWISLAILFYSYLGYGILVFLLNNIRVLFSATKKIVSPEIPVTLIITAYNEAAILPQKITNTLAIDYPGEKLKILIVTDGSTDSSEQIVKNYPKVELLHQQERMGKYAAIKRAMKNVTTPVVVFSDANTMLNPECISRIMVHFDDSIVGAVAGEKKIMQNNYASAVGEAEGLYWQYESFMKKLDAELYTVVGAAGELFALRTNLFRELNDDLILDDFVLSMQVCLQGYKIAYEPDAFATEWPSASLAEEEKRKVRISAGAYQSLHYLNGILNFFKHPLLSFQFISRRLLRWVFCPLMLLLVFFSNASVALNAGNKFYQVLFIGQLVFYVFSVLGWLFIKAGKRAGLFTVPFYFVFMNYCLVKGFFRFVRGGQSVLWEKSIRQAVE